MQLLKKLPRSKFVRENFYYCTQNFFLTDNNIILTETYNPELMRMREHSMFKNEGTTNIFPCSYYCNVQNKKQLYGTQSTRRRIKDAKEESLFVWPVNRGQKKVGFDITVEQNTKRFHIEYAKIKLRDIRPLT